MNTICLTLREYVNSPQPPGRIDRRRGVISGVKILGLTSRNNRRYPLETLAEAIPLYQNAKVNLNHPDGNPTEPRRYQDRFGMVRNVRVIENEGLFADFHFNPKHLYAEQLLWDAENVGFSHNIEAEVVQESDIQIVQKILAVRSVDLVADPATTQGLFESCEQSNKQQQQCCNSCCGQIEKMLAEHLLLAKNLLNTSLTVSQPTAREQAVAESTPDNARSFVEIIT
ncbi:MAG: hypothetical protein FWH27_15980 [Planctomycetaceae bacterium]|nr:hypothetical protein [Planctomycetaceae bacterium]